MRDPKYAPYSERHMGVYFVQCRMSSRIKIGWSSDIPRRVRDIHNNTPAGVRFLTAIPGASMRKEADLHLRFRDLRRHMEWFECDPELLNYLFWRRKEEPFEWMERAKGFTGTTEEELDEIIVRSKK